MQGQLPRLMAAISGLSPEQLQQIPDPAYSTTLGYDLLHALRDEPNHQGEIWLLRKMYAKR